MLVFYNFLKRLFPLYFWYFQNYRISEFKNQIQKWVYTWYLEYSIINSHVYTHGFFIKLLKSHYCLIFFFTTLLMWSWWFTSCCKFTMSMTYLRYLYIYKTATILTTKPVKTKIILRHSPLLISNTMKQKTKLKMTIDNNKLTCSGFTGTCMSRFRLKWPGKYQIIIGH